MLTPEQYSEKLYAEDEQLNKVKQSIEDSGIRDVSVVPGYGRLLTLLVKSSGAKSALEIGALGGYSGICLARGLSEGGKLLSLELKEENAAMARSNMAAAGYGEIVDYRVGPALDSLIELERQGQRFDFFLSMQTKRITRYIWNMRSNWLYPGRSSLGTTRCCAAVP